MSSEIVRGFGRILARMAAMTLLGLALGQVAPAFADPSAEQAVVSRLEVLEAKVTVKARVECKRYHGKVLNCTTDPSPAVAEA